MLYRSGIKDIFAQVAKNAHYRVLDARVNAVIMKAKRVCPASAHHMHCSCTADALLTQIGFFNWGGPSCQQMI